ncbi:MAG TPA: ABC transporter permease [Bryobacteraceae bacterium]|jgi:predicted permease
MFKRIVSSLGFALRRSKFEFELDSELRDHIEKYRDDLVSRGVAPDEAEFRARCEFGSVVTVKEDVREASGLAWPDALARNFRFALRMLRKNPFFALAAMLVLALSIGANVAVFAVVDRLLLRPLPYPEADRLARVSIVTRSSRGEDEDTSVDGRTWEYLRDRVHSLDLALQAQPKPVNLVASGGVQYVPELRVSSGYFRVLGVKPLIGREIDPAEDHPGGPPVAIVSYGLWTSKLGNDSRIIGSKILLRGEPYTVLGVMPPGFVSIPPAEVWTPLRPSTSGEGGGTNYALLARVQPAYRIEQAEAELNVLSSSPDAQPHRASGISIGYRLVSVQRAAADDRQIPLGPPLLILWAAVGVVLLIGCINVAGLILARGATRRQEIATRLALGSGRRGIAAQLLLESSLLAAAGGITGLALGYVFLRALNQLAAKPLDLAQPAGIDFRVLGAGAATILLTAILSGLYPAWSVAGLDIREALATGGRTTRSRFRARRGFVVAQVALSMVLLVGFGLVLRTLVQLTELSPGYDGHRVLTASLPLQDARYSTAASINRLYSAGLARLREYPGVEAAGVGLTLPYERALNDGVRVIDGPRARPENRIANVTYVTPGYFEALRFRLLRGRLFTGTDRADSRPVAIVNESFVRRFLKDDEPLGRHLGGNREIIGVVGDVQVPGFGAPLSTFANLYLPVMQIQDDYFQLIHRWFAPSWVVCASGPQSAIASAMRASLASVDPLLAFSEFRPMDEVRRDAFGLERLESVLFGALAGLALMLCAIGILGLMVQTVVERTREFGIRIALGSSRSHAVFAIASQGIVLAAVGTAIGIGLSLWAGKLFQGLIYRVKATDPVTFAVVSLTLLSAAATASLLPSIKIARIDPARILREE